jgi:hypothetical protein
VTLRKDTDEPWKKPSETLLKARKSISAGVVPHSDLVGVWAGRVVMHSVVSVSWLSFFSFLAGVWCLGLLHGYNSSQFPSFFETATSTRC